MKVKHNDSNQEFQVDRISILIDKDLEKALICMKDHPNIVRYHQFFKVPGDEEN